MAENQRQSTAGDSYEDSSGYGTPVMRSDRRTQQQQLYTRSSEVRRMDEDSSNVYDSIRLLRPGTCRQIKVSNVSEKCTEDFLPLYFESRKTFGRELKVEHVDFDKGDDFAVVTFQTSEDAKTVMEVHKARPCTEHGRQLDIELYLESNAKDEEETKTVQIQDYNPNTSEDTFRYYFENTGKSGGGTIQNLKMHEDNPYVLITFMDVEVVERVLSREHTLDECRLQVNKFFVNKAEILFSNLPLDSSVDTISNFCEVKLGQEVVSATFSEDKSKILVSFKKAINFRLAEEKCKRCSIHNCYMTPHQVPVTRAIIATNIDPDSTRDDFWYYFENHRQSSGGDVQDVILKSTDGYCLVFFKDPKVVQSVCSQLEHKVRGSVLKVEPFKSCLGQPVRFTFPDPVSMDTLDPYKLKLLETHDKHKDEMTKTLAELYASVSWESPFPKVECTITSTIKDYKKIARSWTENVKKVIDDFAETVEVMDIKFELDELTDVKKELQALNIDNPEEVLVKVDTKNSKVVLIAPKHCITSLSAQVKQAIDKAKEDHRQRKERKTEKKQFKPWSIRYLKAIGFTREMAQQFEKAEIQLNEDTCEVTITATQKVIKDILLEVHSVIEQVNTHRLELEKGQIELLSNEATRDKVNAKMRNKGICDVWELDGQEVMLYAEENDDLTRMKNVIEKMLTKISVDVDKKQRDLLSSKEWNELKTRLSREFHGCVVIKVNDDKLEIYTILENEESVDRQVKSFFSKNTVYKKEIPLDATKMKFIQTYMKGDLDSEIRSLSKTGKPLQYNLHTSKLTIEGTADELKAAQAVIKKLEGKVVCKPCNLQKRGVYCYFSSQKGREAINNVQRGALVIIDVKGKGLGSSIGKGKRKSTESNAPTHYAKCVLKSGHKVIVCGGDMTELAVDVMVNASNKDMKLTGGLASVIAKKGGWNIQQECDNHIQQNGSLSVGDVFMGGAGKLKCKAIAHAVGPVWHDGKQDEEKNLILAVENCMRETENKQLMSIAVPALSAGIFGYPVDKACLVITKTIKAYFKSKTDSIIGEVYLCDINERTTQSFIEAAKATFRQCKILADIGTTDSAVKKHAWLTKSSSSNDNGSKSKTSAKCNPVKVVQGQIAQEKVDVIVNSTSSDLQLDKGKSSQAILEAAGRGIQEECSNKYPSGIFTGQVAMTTGGKLQCRQVFHVVLEPYRKAQHMHPIQGLKKSMEACLREADRQGYTSIAFPAMGTGAQGYPKEQVANEMFKCVADYFKRNKNSSLTRVRFVIFHKDNELFDIFISEEKHWTGQDDSGYSPRGNTSGLGKILKLQRDYGEFEFGSIKVKIYQGDITEQKTDAIVASSNPDLDLTKGAVTKAIVKKGGQEIVQDCAKQRKEIQKHGVTVTNAGQLQAKYIIHVDTKYNLKEWEPMILKCLDLADNHAFSSIAFPALGTSVGCKPDDIARLFSRVLTRFHQQTPKHLQRVSIVVFIPNMLRLFIDGMKTSINTGLSRSGSTKGPRDKHPGQQERHPNRQSKPDNMDDVCSLNIYGTEDGRIDKAIRQLETDVKQNWNIRQIKCTTLNELGSSRVDKIQECGKKNHVIVDVDETGGLIDLTGLPANIMTVSEQVHKIMRDFDEAQHKKKLAKLMKNIIKWFYIKDNKSLPFPDRENLRIEEAYSQKKATVRIKDNSGGEYEINFNDMKEWDISKPTVTFPVLRKDLMKDVGHETPKAWTMMRDDQQLQLVTLQPSSKEYQMVEQHFVNTLGRQPSINKIVRIQNVTLYRQYAAKKEQMESINPQQKNERMLWHGTDVSALDSINNHGFNRSYCGKNATALGAGVYFAVNASYSDQGTYTPVDSSGNKHMYRARVLTGSFTTGNHGLRVPPVKDPNNQHILYDSVTNNTSSPAMFVVFNDTQAYPEHIITYK